MDYGKSECKISGTGADEALKFIFLPLMFAAVSASLVLGSRHVAGSLTCPELIWNECGPLEAIAWLVLVSCDRRSTHVLGFSSLACLQTCECESGTQFENIRLILA